MVGQEQRKLGGVGADGGKNWGSRHLAHARFGCLEHHMQLLGDAEGQLCHVLLDDLQRMPLDFQSFGERRIGFFETAPLLTVLLTESLPIQFTQALLISLLRPQYENKSIGLELNSSFV